ncbi:MAG: DUF4956 domain-containing protein [Bacteroidetes bacterium]|nr:DUF4956 domain-containing protein [Bacteroidota bacterium]MCA6442309.1 DUF4956 domain-containing protein [Bacteroidota bacterium]
MDSTALQSTEELIKMLQKFGARFLIDIFFMFILIRFVYYRYYKRSDLFFTFFIFNIVIFLISFLLNKVELSMGAAFGLFAVFSMLRYRTEDISIKDMSYLFLVIAIGLVAAVTKIKDTSDVYEYLFLGLINTIIILSAYLFESSLLFKKENVQLIIYEKIELIKANATSELILDLKERTGLNIHRISISKIDFLKDSAQIKVYYYDAD